MNAIRFLDSVINLEQACFFERGEYEGKPSINITFPAIRKSDENPNEEFLGRSLWFSNEKYRDAAFDVLCDKIGATTLIDRCESVVELRATT